MANGDIVIFDKVILTNNICVYRNVLTSGMQLIVSILLFSDIYEGEQLNMHIEKKNSFFILTSFLFLKWLPWLKLARKNLC